MTGCQYRDQTAILEYLLPVNLPIVRARLDRIVNVIATAQEWFAQQPAGSIDGLVLSNIGELMSQEESGRLFTALLPAATSTQRYVIFGQGALLDSGILLTEPWEGFEDAG